jgi:V8-like Glu-specific endopeptidase
MSIVAGTGLAAGGLAAANAPAAAGVRAGGVQAATYRVSTAAQHAAVVFWTPARMMAATGGPRRPGAGMTPGAVHAPVAPKGTPTAVKFNGVPTTGALFYTTGTAGHFCTASVTDSQPGDLVLTAAHCVYGAGYATNLAYVPEYHNGKRPYGTWPVTSITIANRWRTAHDANLDYAFLGVAEQNGQQIQSVTKGLALSLNGGYVMDVEVIGYNDTDDQPVHCYTRSFEFHLEQLEFYCHDFWTGTSGGPWITAFNASTGTGTVHGVIGGYEDGGDYEWASYSAYFGTHMAALYQQAVQAQPTPPTQPTPPASPTPSAGLHDLAPRPATNQAGSASGYITLVPYISPSGSASSSSRVPSGSLK